MKKEEILVPFLLAGGNRNWIPREPEIVKKSLLSWTTKVESHPRPKRYSSRSGVFTRPSVLRDSLRPSKPNLGGSPEKDKEQNNDDHGQPQD